MRKVPKQIFWILLASIGLLFVAIVTFFVWSARDMIRCNTSIRDLARNQRGDRLVLEEQYCSGFGASITDTVRLQLASRRASEIVFSYEPYLGVEALPELQVAWRNNRTALIRISRVDEVFVRRSAIGNYRISLQIGQIKP